MGRASARAGSSVASPHQTDPSLTSRFSDAKHRVQGLASRIWSLGSRVNLWLSKFDTAPALRTSTPRSRRRKPVRLAGERDPLWRRHVPGRDKGGPGLAGFGVVLGGSAGNRRNVDQMMAVGALNLAARCLFVALQVLLAVGTGKFEFTHRFQGVGFVLLLRTWSKRRLFRCVDLRPRRCAPNVHDARMVYHENCIAVG